MSTPSGGQRGQQRGSAGGRRAGGSSGSGTGKPAPRGARRVGDRDGASPRRAASDRDRSKQTGAGRDRNPNADRGSRGGTGRERTQGTDRADRGGRDGTGRERSQSTDRTARGTGGRDRAASTDRSSAGAAGRGRARPAAPGREARSSASRPARAEVRTRAERIPRGEEPALPDGLDVSMLDRSVRAELRSLSKANAEIVAGHLIAAGFAVDTDPQRALAHARAARARASRLAVVREAVGVAAYHAEEWTEALTELRTARRISGDPRNLPLLADCERALGRPAQAVRMLTDPDVRKLDPEARAELLIVVAGARRDLGQLDAALAVLARGGLDRERPRPGSVRLWYAYADVLEALGRTEDAATWFAASAALDVDGDTDAAERAAALL